MRLFLALLLVLQSTSCFACPYGSWTFDFAKVGATSRYAKGAILVIGRVAEVAPADKRGIHVVTIEVLKPYTDDLHLGPSAMVTALAEMTRLRGARRCRRNRPLRSARGNRRLSSGIATERELICAICPPRSGGPTIRKLLIGAGVMIGLSAAVALALIPAGVPSEAIQSSVIRTEAMLDRAWSLPVAASFGRRVDWQSNASRCGPASVANVLRSLGEAADTEAEVLAGTGRCWTGFCIVGLTLDELADIARAHTRRKVTVLRDLSEVEFREHLRRSNDPGRRYIINFSRREIFGAGSGHHSPIGGYLEDEDLVLVLDVNRAFQPWLVERERLFAAMDTLDGGSKRGMLMIE